MLTTERYAPSFAGKGAFAPILRLTGVVGAVAGLGYVYQKSCLRFYGWEENAREVEMDMREMVDKVKKGEPLYGHTELTPYMQGIAARNSRFSSLLFSIVPMANFTNHGQVRQTPLMKTDGDGRLTNKTARCGHSQVLSAGGARAGSRENEEMI